MHRTHGDTKFGGHAGGQRLDVGELRAGHPSVVVVSITPYGTTGPWADRRATEFTLQANVAMAAALSFVLGAITWAALAFARSLTGSSVAAAG